MRDEFHLAASLSHCDDLQGHFNRTERAIINANRNTCTFPTITSQNVSTVKPAYYQKIQSPISCLGAERFDAI